MKKISKSKEKKLRATIDDLKEEMFKEAENQVAQVLLVSLEQLFLDVTDELLDAQNKYKKKQISHARMFITERQIENYSKITKAWTEFIRDHKIEITKESTGA